MWKRKTTFPVLVIVKRQLENSPLLREKPTLGSKCLLVFLPYHFQVIGLLFLTCCFPFGSFLLRTFPGLHDGEFGIRVDAFGANDEAKTISKVQTDKSQGIL